MLLGLLGFTVTNGVGFFASTEGGLLANLFQAQCFPQRYPHRNWGGVGAGRSRKPGRSRAVNSGLGFTLLVLGFAGLLLVGSEFNVLALNAADNVLHFAAAVVLLLVGIGADSRATGVSV